MGSCAIRTISHYPGIINPAFSSNTCFADVVRPFHCIRQSETLQSWCIDFYEHNDCPYMQRPFRTTQRGEAFSRWTDARNENVSPSGTTFSMDCIRHVGVDFLLWKLPNLCEPGFRWRPDPESNSNFLIYWGSALPIRNQRSAIREFGALFYRASRFYRLYSNCLRILVSMVQDEILICPIIVSAFFTWWRLFD